MDENRNFNTSPDYVEQLQWLVRRDRNRPSVILWSVFNEEPLQATPVGYEMVRRATATVKALDDSRPVTAAMNGGTTIAQCIATSSLDAFGATACEKTAQNCHDIEGCNGTGWASQCDGISAGTTPRR